MLEHHETEKLIKKHGRNTIKDSMTEILGQLRQAHKQYSFANRDSIITYVLEELKKGMKEDKGIRPVLNLTGTVLHTNLGRAPLSHQVLDKVTAMAKGYCTLEYNLEEGRRGQRDGSIEKLLSKLVGCESACVVNNNASAVFLALHTLAKEEEVIVSRGEQVEIGGSFRIPDIIQSSGCKMVEVGTTNKTYASDYENAITEETKILLKVHQSNFRTVGFTCAVEGSELVELADRNNIIAMEDLGSGSFVDFSAYGMPYEPTVQQVIEQGMDIVTISGDKLLGGPQVGIIMGKKHLVDKIKKHPLMRMLRCDKLTLVALQEVLKIYMEERHIQELPSLTMLTASVSDLNKRGMELIHQIKSHLPDLDIQLQEIEDQPGGGSLPHTRIAGVALVLNIEEGSTVQVQKRLRSLPVPIICRIKETSIIFSLRTLQLHEESIFIEQLVRVMKEVA